MMTSEPAAGRREWLKLQIVPVIAIGDFNMDYDFHSGKGNLASEAMLNGDVWKWVKPEGLLDTNWSDRDDGADNYPESTLDFGFVNALVSNVTSRVIVREGDFPDDEPTTDHWPVQLILD